MPHGISDSIRDSLIALVLVLVAGKARHDRRERALGDAYQIIHRVQNLFFVQFHQRIKRPPSRSPALPSFIKSATRDQTHAPLAALAPEPRVHLTRRHGVFAPNSKHRIQITPGQRGKGGVQAKVAANNWLEKTPEERHWAMTESLLKDKQEAMPGSVLAC